MLDRIAELGALLRRNGVGVSITEVMDAGRAAAAVGLADPARLRDALGAALIKRAPDRAIFDELFELTFGGGAAAAARLAPLE